MMNVPPTESIRNVAVVSNTGSGKTSLVEALAYFAGSLPSLGSILAGTTTSDFEPEEITSPDVVQHQRPSLFLQRHVAQPSRYPRFAQLCRRDAIGLARGGWRHPGCECLHGGAQ